MEFLLRAPGARRRPPLCGMAVLAWGIFRGEEVDGEVLVGAEEHGVDVWGDSGPGAADPLAFSVGEAFSKWQKTGTANEPASSMVASRGPLHRVPLHGRGRVVVYAVLPSETKHFSLI